HESQSKLEMLVREHVSTAAALREATAQSERANAAKADFLAKMSHELRTPLNAIIGYSQPLREEAEEEGDSETLHDLDRIHGASQELLRLINDILDLAKIEAGKMEIYEELTPLHELVTSAASAFADAARAQGNSLSVAVTGELGSI